jgi:hypothetical protein
MTPAVSQGKKRRNTMQRARKQGLKRRHHKVRRQLETDQRTYGSINREASLALGGWKAAPSTDLVAVLRNEKAEEEMFRQRQRRAKCLQEEDECATVEQRPARVRGGNGEGRATPTKGAP